MNAHHDPRIPIYMLTGFLGAGKTTILSALLAAGRLDKTLLIINEVGETGVDQELLRDAELDAPLLLPGGCMCCTLKGDLGYTLRDIQLRIERGTAKPFQQVVIETTGIADPAPILQTILTDRWVSARYRIGRTVTVADAEHLVATCDENPTAVSQLVHADTVLLSKTDLVASEEAAVARSLVASIAPDAEMLNSREAVAHHWNFTQVSGNFRKGVQTAGCCAIHAGTDGECGPVHGVATIQIEIPDGIPWRRFAALMDQFTLANAPNLLRIKGFVRPRESDRPLCIQAVRATFYPPQITNGSDPLSGMNIVTVIHKGHLCETSLRTLKNNLAIAETSRRARERGEVSSPSDMIGGSR